MALIKCPACGQTVLSIASVCPKCGHMLMQNPLAQGGDGEFVECPRCSKFIPQDADRCGFCGYPRRARRRMWWAAGGAALVVALVAGVIGATQLLDRGGASSPSTPPQAAEEPSPELAPAESTEAGSHEQEPVPSSRPVVVTRPAQETEDSAGGRPADTPATEAVTPAAPPRPLAAVPSTVNRWATTWANLRAGPGTDYPVVRILQPGERIRVASLRRGFWAVYDAGAVEGYVANSVLSDRELPADSLPGTASGPVTP